MAGEAEAFATIVGTIGDLFGGTTTQKGTTRGEAASITGATKKGRTTEKLNIDQVALQRIIQDVLGGSGGLATIFAGEQQAGIFDSSVAAQASGDLAAKLVGELAKLIAAARLRSTSRPFTVSSMARAMLRAKGRPRSSGPLVNW